MNKILSILDPGCFIWDENDFNDNKSMYYELLDKLVELINNLELGGFTYLLRSDLVDILTDSFPVKLINEEINRDDLSDIISLFFVFISKIGDDIIDFDPINNDATSFPDLNRKHYSNDVIEEMNFLLSYVSTLSNTLLGISLEDLWLHEVDIVTIYDSLGNEVSNIKIVTNPAKLPEIIHNTEPVFEPSDKHKEPGGWGTILPDYLEEKCYGLIKKGVKGNGNSEALYAFCEEYNQYIIFRLTVNNIYHAYPIQEDDVPNNIKQELVVK